MNVIHVALRWARSASAEKVRDQLDHERSMDDAVCTILKFERIPYQFLPFWSLLGISILRQRFVDVNTQMEALWNYPESAVIIFFAFSLLTDTYNVFVPLKII